MMNTAYLNLLSELDNKYGVDLQDDEKVVFTAELDIFGTEKDRNLGMGAKFTLTNQRIIADNGLGVWTNDILEDVVSCNKVEYKKLFGLLKGVYFSVDLNKEVVFDNGKQKLTGFHFYFNAEDTAKFEKIINHL